MEFLAFVEALRAWAEQRTDVRGVAIVGSYARGAETSQSDIDVMVMTTEPARYLDGHEWLREFGDVRTWRREDWGAVQSVRASYGAGSEVEFGITSPAWADVPMDEGTRSVVAGGFRVVFEREGVLTRLLASFAR